jgi:hypothetical protein
MADASQNSTFVLEPIQALLAGEGAGGKGLHRADTIEISLAGQVHASHAALTEGAQNLEAAEKI